MGLDRRTAALWLVLGCALVSGVAVLHLPGLPADVGPPLSSLIHAATALAAGVALLRRARTASAGLRRGRTLLGAALLLAGVLGLLSAVSSSAPGALSEASVLGRLAIVPFVALALLSYPAIGAERASAVRSLLDALVAATALWFTCYALLLGPTRIVDGPRALSLIPAATDIVMLSLVLGVLLRVAPAARREVLLVGTGMSLVLTADLVSSALPALAGLTASGSGALSQAGLLLVLLAAVTSPPDVSRDTAVEVPDSRLAVLPHVVAVAAIAVAGEMALTGDPLSGSQFVVAIVFVVALMLRHTIGSRDRSALEARLRSNEELFRSLVTGVSDLITLHRQSGEVIYASPAVQRVLGRPGQGLSPRDINSVLHPDDRHLFAESWARAVASPGQTIECRGRVRSASGEFRWMQTLMCNRLDEGNVAGVIVNLRDVHERQELEQQLISAAHSDALTGLGNLTWARRILSEYYADPLARATVVLIDLDGFKSVNDTFGHAQGDALLVQVAGRLRGCVRDEDEVARIGGDEFVLVLRDEDGTVAERVVEALRAPMSVAGTPLPVGASIGIATTSDAASPDELLRNADLAMYASKAAGRNRITQYRPQMHEAAALRMQIHRGLRRALDSGHLTLNYQPIVSLPHGEVIGGEALLRWRDPELGPISPEVFIPIAEESGIISEIDVWVLDRACQDIRGWLDAGVGVPRISVNVSRRHMTTELPRLVSEALGRYGLTGDRLCIEVTETAVVPDAALATAVLHGVRALGVTVSLDDFGSGESSLSQLARLGVDTVKIDRSFTSTAVDDAGARRLLTSIVQVCQSLALPVVAEGIETAELAGLLARMGCGQGQGWHFSRDVPAELFLGLLTGGRLPLRARTERPATLAV